MPLAAPPTSGASDTEPDLDLQAEPILSVDATAAPDAAESAPPTDADMWARLLGDTAAQPEPEAAAPIAPEPESDGLVALKPEAEADVVTPEPDPVPEIAPEPEALVVAEPESGGLVTPEPEAKAERAERTVAALGQFLAAVHVARTQHHA